MTATALPDLGVEQAAELLHRALAESEYVRVPIDAEDSRSRHVLLVAPGAPAFLDDVAVGRTLAAAFTVEIHDDDLERQVVGESLIGAYKLTLEAIS